MTQKQFKEALLRGQGRCIKAVELETTKYFSIILWACSHEVAFDAQCEGSRAWFVYQLISCYQDKTPFLQKTIESFAKVKSDNGWKVLYLAELLSFWAADGESMAKEALWHKYEQLYKALIKSKCPKEGLFPEREDFAMLCQVLAEDKAALVRIVEDVGRLYRERPFYDGFYFDWLFEVKAKRHMGLLSKLARRSENIAAYLNESLAYEKTCEEPYQNRREDRPKQGVALSMWLKNKAGEDTVMQYAEAYLRLENLEERAKALDAFCRCPFPSDPMPIIEDTASECERLREAAWRALECVRHPKVREFALENIQQDVEKILPIFIANYRTTDEKLLVELVQSISIDWECTTPWHGIQLDILRAAGEGVKIPGELLYYIYENTYCSCCREKALRKMGKRRLVTEEMLQECLLDSNEDIRIYARNKLKRNRR